MPLLTFSAVSSIHYNQDSSQYFSHQGWLKSCSTQRSLLSPHSVWLFSTTWQEDNPSLQSTFLVWLLRHFIFLFPIVLAGGSFSLETHSLGDLIQCLDAELHSLIWSFQSQSFSVFHVYLFTWLLNEHHKLSLFQEHFCFPIPTTCLLPGLSVACILQNSSPSMSSILLYLCYLYQEAESNFFSLKSWADINDFDQCNVILVTDILGPSSEGTKNFAASTWASECLLWRSQLLFRNSECFQTTMLWWRPGLPCGEDAWWDKEMAGERQAFSAMWVRRYKMCEWKGHLGYLALWNL